MPRVEPSVRVEAYWPVDPFPIAIVAQSPGRTEVEKGAPLVGASGQLLESCCNKAGIPFDRCLRTNLIGFRPPGDDFIHYFCCNKKDAGGKDYPLPPIGPSKYLHPDWFSEIERLRQELLRYKPNLVVVCGNEALWALCGVFGITKYQGAVQESKLIPGLKVLPIFHPAAALREYTLKAYISQALIKAKKECEFPEIRYARREIWIYPETKDLWEWYKRESESDKLLSADIETPSGMIDCIAFSFRPECSLVVPFWSDLREGQSYWRTLEDEIEAWDFVEFMLANHPILGQNFYCFDFWRLLSDIGIFPRVREDTMVAHHAYQPELTKDLGFLTAVFCNDPAYKVFRPKGSEKTKREE